MKKSIFKIIKIIGWIVFSILTLLILLIVLIQIPFIQQKIKTETITFVENKIGTTVKMERISISFPKEIVVKGFYLESQEKDTLIAVDRLGVDISLFRLLFNEVNVSNIDLEGLKANIKRDDKKRFNFDYIIDAFATENDPKEDTTPMTISVRQIDLSSIALKVDDDYEGHHLDFKLKQFVTRFQDFDLDKMRFSLPKLATDGLEVIYSKHPAAYQQKNEAKEQKEEASSSMPDIRLGMIEMKRTKLNYESVEDFIHAALNLEDFKLSFNQLDLINQNIDIQDLFLNNVQTEVTFLKRPKVGVSANNKEAERDVEVSDSSTRSWNLGIRDLNIKQLNAIYNDNNFVTVKQGIDPNHINIYDFALQLKDFQYTSSSVTGNLQHFSFAEKSGFVLNQARSYFQYGEQSSFLKNLYLETPNTKFKSSVVLNYQDINTLQKELDKMSIDLFISNSYFGFKDLYLLMPDVLKTNGLNGLQNEKVELAWNIKGLVSDLTIEKFYLNIFGSSFINVEGKIKGVPDIKKMFVDVAVKDFQTTAKDIKKLCPPSLLPKDIEIPALLSFNGNVKGTAKDVTTNLKLRSSSGNITLDGSFNQRVKNKEKYKLTIAVENLDVGRIIKNDSIGAITFSGKVDGVGLLPETVVASTSLKLQKATYNGYTYKDIGLEGSIDKGVYNFYTDNLDPNLLYDVKANGVWTKEQLSLNLLANLKNIDFQNLKLKQEEAFIQGILEINMPNIFPNNLQGTVTAKDFLIGTTAGLFAINPIKFEATAEADYRKMTFNSQVLDFEMKGNYLLTHLGDAILSTLKKYYTAEVVVEELKSKKNIQKEDVQESIAPQSFTYKINIKNDPIYQRVLPNLEEIQPIEFVGAYKQSEDYLSFKGLIPALAYGEVLVDSITVDFSTSQDKKLSYYLKINGISNASFGINNLQIDGFAQNNRIDFNLKLLDENKKLQYLIGAEVFASLKQHKVRIKELDFMLDYNKWNVDKNNRIVVSEEGIYVSDFVLSQGESSIKIQSDKETTNSPLSIDLKDFSIATITKMVKKDKLIAQGYINGNVYLQNIATDLRFISDLTISDLGVFEIILGNLSVDVKNETTSKYLANVVLQGSQNKISLNGSADMDLQEMDLKLAIEELRLKALEGFSMGNLSNSQGYISGNITLDGKFTDPKILGEILFNDISLHVNPINADFKEINDKISFTNKGIEFDKFRIIDVDGNILLIDGQLITKNYIDYKFNIDIKAVDFKAISSTAKNNDLYYGTLVFDSNIQLRGNMETPKVTGQIRVSDKTNFTIVMPQEDPSIADREGIVEFIDQESLREAALRKYNDDFNNSKFKGLDVSVAILVDKNAIFSMIMDQQSGDKVQISGEGDIVAGIDQSGKITLTGRYEFSEGSYDLSFNFIKRKFLVQEGSSILFVGEPTDAILNLTAIYETKVSPFDLMQNQIASLSPTQQNMYKQQLPFQTLLMMNGEVLKPEISFDIVLKEGASSASGDVITNVKTKLEQLRANETELNKQVFALLLFNSFIGESPFDSGVGISAGTMARQSVNRLLSDQLNNFAGNLIKGVDLNFNLESSEDFSTGTKSNRTDLNVAVSKNLFSDRLKVTVGSSFEVEGNRRENEQAANIAGDIEMEYALTRDGRYILRVYRKNTYDVALQGQVVETGVGFVITMSYEKFKELFEQSKDKKELKKQLKNEADRKKE